MSFGGALFSPITFGDVAKLGFNLARACLVNWVELIFVIRRVRSFGAVLWSPPNYCLEQSHSQSQILPVGKSWDCLGTYFPHHPNDPPLSSFTA